MVQVIEEKKGIRIGRLDSVGRVIGEMGRVYRHMRRGEVDTLDGSRLVNVLTAMRQAMQEEEFERRIRALEEHDATNARDATVTAGAPAPLGNGANGHDDVRIGSPSGPDHGNRREGRRP